MATLKIKLNTQWCKWCKRITGVQNGTCVVCNERMAKELVGRKWEECEQCGFRDYISPSGNEGYLCPKCGCKIESLDTNPKYFYQ